MFFFNNNSLNCLASLCLLAGTLILGSCQHSKSINIYYENSSDVNEKISLETFLNGKLIDTRVVNRGDTLIKMSNLSLNLDNIGDTFRLQFSVPEKSYKTECAFSTKELKEGSWIHVNLREIMFHKGDQIPGGVLAKDSIMDGDFYCELVQNPKYTNNFFDD